MIQAPLPADRFVEIYQGRHLLVYGAANELMLALKLTSGRGRDIGDIIHLAAQTGRSTQMTCWTHGLASTAPFPTLRRIAASSTASSMTT